MAKLTRDDLLKPTTMTCAKCGGTLHVIPYETTAHIGKKVHTYIKTMNICGTCTFK